MESNPNSIYFHMDNGGHTFKVDTYGNLTINTGFFGYSETALRLGSANEEDTPAGEWLRDLSEFLLLQANRVDAENTIS